MFSVFGFYTNRVSSIFRAQKSIINKKYKLQNMMGKSGSNKGGNLKNIEKLKSVLLVDDDDTTNFINKILLEKLEIAEQIHVVKNGKEALDYINNAGGDSDVNYVFKIPELIFLDINMPVMDGFEFLKIFRKIEHDHELKVVIVLLSNLHHEEDEVENLTFKSASIEFMEKPLTIEKITGLFETHFLNVSA